VIENRASSGLDTYSLTTVIPSERESRLPG
jgi:hypothetical protein